MILAILSWLIVAAVLAVAIVSVLPLPLWNKLANLLTMAAFAWRLR